MTENKRSLADWLTHIESVHHRSVDLGLERIRRVIGNLDILPLPYPLINVAGTNGKGSSVALLEAMLSAAGPRVGSFTSPHLVHYTERIRIDGRPVSAAELCGVFADIEAARREVPLTYFEFGALAALLLFRARDIDIAVMEVGMGGRLDAVNAVDADVALITSVAIDHTQWLGHDRDHIAVEKAGIMRSGRPVVYAEPHPPATLTAEAHRIQARLYRQPDDFYFRAHGDRWDWHGPVWRRLGLPRPALPGPVQLQNAAGVLMVLECLPGGLQIGNPAVRSGLRSVRAPGRFQILAGRPTVVLDVAHNPASVSVLRKQLHSLPGCGRTLAVCAMLRDKPIELMVRTLAADVDRWYVAAVNSPRGTTGEQMHERVTAGISEVVAAPAVHLCPSVVDAFGAARSEAAAGDTIVVFGSFYTVGDIIDHLNLPSV